MTDFINDRYETISKKMEDAKKLLAEIVSELGPETMHFNIVRAELDMIERKKSKLIEDIRILENDIELKKQVGQKIIDTANEEAKKHMDAATTRNAESIRLLDEVRMFVVDADLKRKMGQLEDRALKV